VFTELLKKLALKLDELAIPYMVIGGQAVLVYGEPRLTRDIDITLGLGTEALDRILAIAAQLQLTVIPRDVADFVHRTMVLPVEDTASHIRVDFIFSLSAYEREALNRTRRIKLDETEISFASLEDVIVHKVVAGRPRDIEDVRILLIKNPAGDWAYVRRWLGELDRALSTSHVRTFETALTEAGIS
jgi:predicted nucleotidyltransferase